MAWGQSIAQGLGRIGSEAGVGVDANLNTALEIIRNKLLNQEVQARVQEQQLRMKQMQQPIPEGIIQTPQGVFGATFDPNKGQYGASPLQGIPSSTAAVSPEAIERFITSLPSERQKSAREVAASFTGLRDNEGLVKWMAQESLKEPPPKPESSVAEKRAQAEKDAAALGYKPGTREFIKKVVELTNPAAAKVTFNIPSPGSAPNVPVPNVAGSGGGAVDSNPQFAALKAKNPQMAALVREIADYKVNPQTLSNRGGHREQVLGLVSMIDPTYDQTQFAARNRLRQDFTSGQGARNIRSLNTAVSHLDTLGKAAIDLKNGPIPLWNEIANFSLAHTGDPRVARFNSAANAVESEMANVFKGTGATDQEIKAWRSNLSNAMSPQQIDGAIRQLVALMGGRLDALQEQFRTGMGKPMDFAILTPKSKELLKKLGGDEQQQSEQGSPVYVNGQIVGYTTDGKTMTKVGGQ